MDTIFAGYETVANADTVTVRLGKSVSLGNLSKMHCHIELQNMSCIGENAANKHLQFYYFISKANDEL